MKRQNIADNNTALHLVTVAGRGSFATPQNEAVKMSKTEQKPMGATQFILTVLSTKATKPLQHIPGL